MQVSNKEERKEQEIMKKLFSNRRIGTKASLYAAIITLMLFVGATSSHAAYEFYVQITGETTGLMTTGNSIRANWLNYLPAINYTNNIGLPVGSATPTYSQVQIVAEVNKCLPLLLNSLISKEYVEIMIKHVRTNATGVEYVFDSTLLSKARIIDVKLWNQTSTTTYELMTITVDYAAINLSITGGSSFTGGK